MLTTTLFQAVRSGVRATFTLAPQQQRLTELSRLSALAQRGPTGLTSPRLRLGDRARILSWMLPVAPLLAGPYGSRAFGPVPYGYDWSPVTSLALDECPQDPRACVGSRFAPTGSSGSRFAVPSTLTSRDRSTNLTFDSREPPVGVS